MCVVVGCLRCGRVWACTRVSPGWRPVCCPHTRKASPGPAALCSCLMAVFSSNLPVHCPTGTAPGPGTLGVRSRTSVGCTHVGAPQTAVCSVGAHVDGGTGGCLPARTRVRPEWAREHCPERLYRLSLLQARGGPAVPGPCQLLGHSSSSSRGPSGSREAFL